MWTRAGIGDAGISPLPCSIPEAATAAAAAAAAVAVAVAAVVAAFVKESNTQPRRLKAQGGEGLKGPAADSHL